jgi:cysteine-rich repeat protein
MRAHTAIALSLTGLVAAGAAGSEGTRLVQCQQRIAAASTHFLTARRNLLSRCVAKALRCRGALAGTANAACLDAVGSGCRARLAALGRSGTRLEQAGPRCTATQGVSSNGFFGTDGLAFETLAVFCPQMQMRAAEPSDTSRCQRWALACSDDSALVSAAPRAGALLLQLGVPLEQGPHCLISDPCGNGEVDPGEECDDSLENSDVIPDACRTTCRDAACGDGVVDADEECDDGNLTDGDSCDSECLPTDGVCGNGVLEADEDCDDGNLLDGDLCLSDCTLPDGVCGNARVEDDEDCDDGNRVAGDGCEPDCTVTPDVCGNGRVETDEECDEGLRNSDVVPDRCRADCSAPSCGDGVIDAAHGEQCEPPETLLCTPDCRLRFSVGVAALRTAGTDNLARCQDGLLRTGAQLFERTRTRVARCVLGVARCMLGLAAGNRQDACFTAANRRCVAAAAARATLRARAVARAAAGCAAGRGGAPLGVERLLDASTGLGFVQLAGSCPLAGTGTPGVGELLACALEHVQCSAENAVARSVPKAYELLWGTSVDADTDFPCVTDPEA